MRLYYGTVCALLIATLPCGAVISLTSPTSEFTAVGLGGPSDPTTDNQANRADLELVGDDTAGLSAFYLKFDNGGTADRADGEIAFRLRISGNQGQVTVGGNVYVGLDLTGDGALDYFIAHEGKNDQNLLILRSGTGANDSPSTVTLGDTLFSEDATAANVNFSAVSTIDTNLTGLGYDPYDLDADNTPKSGEDHFLTFKIDFASLVHVVRTDAQNGVIDEQYVLFDESSALQMITVTSQNTNNINSDFGGINDSERDPDLTFNDPESPGGSSTTITIDGQITVPEPAGIACVLGLLCLGLAAFRRRPAYRL